MSGKIVIGRGGLRGVAEPDPGADAFDIRLDDGRRLSVPTALVLPRADGGPSRPPAAPAAKGRP